MSDSDVNTRVNSKKRSMHSLASQSCRQNVLSPTSAIKVAWRIHACKIHNWLSVVKNSKIRGIQLIDVTSMEKSLENSTRRLKFGKIFIPEKYKEKTELSMQFFFTCMSVNLSRSHLWSDEVWFNLIFIYRSLKVSSCKILSFCGVHFWLWPLIKLKILNFLNFTEIYSFQTDKCHSVVVFHSRLTHKSPLIDLNSPAFDTNWSKLCQFSFKSW